MEGFHLIGEFHILPERACIPEFGWKHAKKMRTSGETKESEGGEKVLEDYAHYQGGRHKL